MFFEKMRNIILLLLVVVIFSSCSEYSKVHKSHDYERKYEYAKKCYEKKDYSRAIILFEEVYTTYRGRDKSEELVYMLAYSYYYFGDYFMGSYYFKTYTKQFLSGKHTEECTFMSALCKSLEAPIYKLDQTSTQIAIKEMQLFINYYPNSDRVDEANRLIDEMREKLAKKAYKNAELYYRRRIYLSAMVAFNTMIKDFPDSKLREDAMFMYLKSNYHYAVNSVKNKQKERYRDSKFAYEQFERSYPDSRYIDQAKGYYQIILQKFE